MASDSSWVKKSGGFLILVRWLSFSEFISISILLNLSFKVRLSPSKKKKFYFNENTFKLMKNDFYFILKVFFVFKILIFVLTFFDVEKRFD